MEKYDVFISYRRDGGEHSAKNLYDRLTARGYKVFYDVETLRSGAFNEKLYSVIEACRDVVVILSPNALDRCQDEKDWVRLEVAHALQKGKNLIPVLLRGFTFPEDLPEDIAALPFQNGVQASMEFFDAFLDKLCGFMLSKPGILGRVKGFLFKKGFIPPLTAGVLLISLIGFGLWGGKALFNMNEGAAASYPATREEENQVSELLYAVEMNMTVLDNIYSTSERVLTACEDYLNDSNAYGYSKLKLEVEYAQEALNKSASQGYPVPQELVDKLSSTQIKAADLKAIGSYGETEAQGRQELLTSLSFLLGPDSSLELSEKKRVVAINRDLWVLAKEALYLGVCDLFLPVDESALQEFRTRFLPSLNSLSSQMALWTRDPVTIEGHWERINTQQQALLNAYAEIVGNQNQALFAQKRALIELLMTMGLTEEEAEKHVEKTLDAQGAIQSAQDELLKLEAELEESKARIREKTAPKEGDDPYLVWGKALHFLSAGMKEDAVAAFQFFYMQMKNKDPLTEEYVPAAIRFVEQTGATGIDYGVLVVGYEPDKPPHDFYKTGDIIVAINSLPSENYNDLNTLMEALPKDKNFTATILRADENGSLKLVDLTITPGQPQVALMELTEEE